LWVRSLARVLGHAHSRTAQPGLSRPLGQSRPCMSDTPDTSPTAALDGALNREALALAAFDHVVARSAGFRARAGQREMAAFIAETLGGVKLGDESVSGEAGLPTAASPWCRPARAWAVGRLRVHRDPAGAGPEQARDHQHRHRGAAGAAHRQGPAGAGRGAAATVRDHRLPIERLRLAKAHRG